MNWVCQLIGDCYFKLIQYEQSLDFYYKVLLMEPNNIYCIYRVGVCNVLLEETNEAKKYFLRGIKIQPKNWIILKKLAHIYEIQEDISTAMTYYKQVLSLNKGDYDVMFRLFKLARISRSEELAEDLARKLYKESLNQDVLSVVKEFLQNKGLIHGSTG